MYENGPENESFREVTVRQWPTKFFASCLLVVMLCTVAATPVAVIYRLRQERIEDEENIVNEQPASPLSGRIANNAADQQ
jgi:hypothetical protein